MPKWATEARKRHLVRLFHRSGGFCVFGERPCPCPELHHYGFYIEGMIRDWVLDDRAQAEAAWQAEREWMHRGPRRLYQGRFDSIRREVFLEQQPDYYLVGISVDALTFKPVARVRIPSTYVHLFVEIGSALKGLSKSARRKASRYGKTLPKETQETVGSLVQKAVADWWTSS
jgi:hypothetical protein